jgi:hypothetical protein
MLIYFRCEHIVSKLITLEKQKLFSPYFITLALYPYALKKKDVALISYRFFHNTVRYFFFKIDASLFEFQVSKVPKFNTDPSTPSLVENVQCFGHRMWGRSFFSQYVTIYQW